MLRLLGMAWQAQCEGLPGWGKRWMLSGGLLRSAGWGHAGQVLGARDMAKVAPGWALARVTVVACLGSEDAQVGGVWVSSVLVLPQRDRWVCLGTVKAQKDASVRSGAGTCAWTLLLLMLSLCREFTGTSDPGEFQLFLGCWWVLEF